VQASDGKLYGMTVNGGANNNGVLFQYDPATSTYTKKLDFNGATKGSNPSFGSLMQASDGKLYGMTWQGGVNNMGVLFQYDTATSTFTKKLDFAGATNGRSPYGSLMQASDGKLYGMTYSGGANDMGVLFQYDTATSTFTKKLDFNGANGSNPQYANLIEIDAHTVVTSITQNLSSEGKIEVYPNPFTNQTTILFNEVQKNTTIKIMDVLGKEIRIINFTGKQLIIEKGEMQNGIYFVQVIGSNKSVVNKKIMIQ
jgi:uncharacterized repeat protein (TIGR03803 family)